MVLLPWPTLDIRLKPYQTCDDLDENISRNIRNNKTLFKDVLLQIWSETDNNNINKLRSKRM